MSEPMFAKRLRDDNFYRKHVEVMVNDADNDIELVLDEEAKDLMLSCQAHAYTFGEDWYTSIFADHLIARAIRVYEGREPGTC